MSDNLFVSETVITRCLISLSKSDIFTTHLDIKNRILGVVIKTLDKHYRDAVFY